VEFTKFFILAAKEIINLHTIVMQQLSYCK